MYDRMYQLLKRFDQLDSPIGMRRHPGKGKTYLPPEAPDPRPGHPILEETTLVVGGGVKISGGCFGTDQDVIARGLTKVKAIQPHIDRIVALAIVNTHAAMRLLAIGDCANKALD